MTTTVYNTHPASPPMNSFVSHLAALLAVYGLGPQSFTPVPHYDGPTDLRTDAILNSLSTMAHRMWAAEDALKKHNINLPPKPTIIAAFSPAGQRVHGHPPGEDKLISGEKFDAEAHCLSCQCGKATSDPNAVEELKLLKAQVQDVARVCNAAARGDLSQKITVPVQGAVMVQMKDAVNTMVVRLRTLTIEVTEVILELEVGKLGGQARVPDVEGVWLNLVRNVNRMSSSFADQVQSISKVTKSIAHGDLGEQMNVEVQGEMLDLKRTVNSVVNQLNTVACEVNRVSLELGMEGILGGQVFVFDAQGMWKVLADNVNLMAMNLTNQVRAVTEVTQAIGSGDWTKRIEVDARGEILEMKEAVNGMAESLSVCG